MAEVRYENLHIEDSDTAAGRALPSVLNAYLSFFESLLVRLHLVRGTKRSFVVLDGISGVISPGRLTLLLGPPGSGKSTLLQALAGKFHHNGPLLVDGSITYNGCTFDDFMPSRSAGYVTQDDTQLAELTVKETLKFSARCQGRGKHPGHLHLPPKQAASQNQQGHAAKSLQADDPTDQRYHVIAQRVLRQLGLDACKDIPIGSDMVRGISGGQKRRVTTGEALAGPQQTFMMDEITTGLDSSTAFHIISHLRDFTHERSATVLIALLQPAPEVYSLFDDVLLLSEGRTIFHGPRQDVEGFFSGLGFRCPPRKGVPNFLQEVTSPKDQQQYWVGERPWSFVCGDAMIEAYMHHTAGQAMAALLAQPFDHLRSNASALVCRCASTALTGWAVLRATLDRELLMLYRTWFVYVFRTAQVALLACVVATLFLRTHIHSTTFTDASLVAGMLFYSLIQALFSGLAELTFTIARLPTFFKHRDDGLFPPWALVISTTIMRLPASLLEATVFTAITYFAAPLSLDAGRFFLMWAFLFLLHSMAVTMFRAAGTVIRIMMVANAVGALAMLLILLMGGYIIPKYNVHPWVVWVYWADPLQWAQRGLLISQFTSKLWATKVPGGVTLGIKELTVHGFPHQFWWVWVSLGALVAANLLFHSVLMLAATYLRPIRRRPNAQSEEALALREYAKHGGPSGRPVILGLAEGGNSERHANLRRLGKVTSLSLESQHGQDGPHGQGQVARGPHTEHQPYKAMAAAHKPIMESGDDLLRSHHVDICDTDPDLADAPEEEFLSTGDLLDTEEDLEKLVEEENAFGMKLPEVASGMSLPFEPMTLAFRDICYFVKCPREMSGKGHAQVVQKGKRRMLQLLHDVSGVFRPRILTCLMGVSGAGKTTLLDVLAGRKTGGRIEGEVWLNGHPKEQASFARVCGFVEQTDIHSPRTTVREALQFSADLRFEGRPGKAELRAFVDEVMDLVELGPIQHSLVGQPGVEGLSVEQRKRLTIAVELVANPSIVFMDEPTSGLDARAAAIVMRTVRNIVNTGRTIVCTIHQPSIDIFETFDELLLLQAGGRTSYAGNLGPNSEDLLSYFQGIPGVAPIPDGLNPATWMLQVTSDSSAAKLGLNFAREYEASSLQSRMYATIASASRPRAGQLPLHFAAPYAQSALSQYRICVRKFFTTFWRNPEYNQTRFSLSVGVALILGACYWRLGDNTENSARIISTLGALLYAFLFLGVLNSIFVQPLVASERQVFYREKAAGMYSVHAWYLAMATVEACYLVLQAILYVLVVYWMAGFTSKPSQFFWFFLFNLLTLMYFTYYGVAAVACTPNLLYAAILSSSFYSFMNLMSGFVIPRPHIPGWWTWLYYANPVSWTLYGMVASNIGEAPGKVFLSTGQRLTVPDFLHVYLDYSHDMIGYAVLVLVGFVVAFWTAGWASFRYLNFNIR